MDCSRGHLVTQEMLDTMDAHHRGKYTPVPEELNRAAVAKLKGLHEAQVSLSSGGKLATWANNQTRNQRKRASRQARGK